MFSTTKNGKSLDYWLRTHGIDRLIVTGIRTEQCCETTTRHASDLGYSVSYAMDATLTFPMVLDRAARIRRPRFATVRSWCCKVGSPRFSTPKPW